MNFVNQSQSVVMQNQSKREITFDTQIENHSKINTGIILLHIWATSAVYEHLDEKGGVGTF